MSDARSFLGKCKSCKRTVQVTCCAADTVDAKRLPTGKVISPKRVAWRIIGGKRDGHQSRLAAVWNGHWQIDIACPHCAAVMMVQAVAGVHSAHECGPKCLASKGPRCECSCGGLNHGRSFAA